MSLQTIDREVPQLDFSNAAHLAFWLPLLSDQLVRQGFGLSEVLGLEMWQISSLLWEELGRD